MESTRDLPSIPRADHRSRATFAPILLVGAMAVAISIVPLTEGRTAAQEPATAERWTIVAQAGGTAGAAAWSPDGQWLAVGIGPRVVRTELDAAGAPSATHASALLPGVVEAIALAGDGRHAVVGLGWHGMAVVDMLASPAPRAVAHLGASAAQLTPVQCRGIPEALPLARVMPAGGGPQPPALPADTVDFVAAHGSLAFVAGAGYLAVLDLREPARPRQLARMAIEVAAVPVVVGQHLYVPVSSHGPERRDTLLSIDLSDTARPVIVGKTHLLGRPTAISIVGQTLAVATSAGLQLIDHTVPTRPRPLTLLKEPVEFIAPLADDSRLLIGSSEQIIFFIQSGFGEQFDTLMVNSLAVIDLGRPAAPRVLGRTTRLNTGQLIGMPGLAGRVALMEQGSGVTVMDYSTSVGRADVVGHLAAGYADRLALDTDVGIVSVIEQSIDTSSRRLLLVERSTGTVTSTLSSVPEVTSANAASGVLALLGPTGVLLIDATSATEPVVAGVISDLKRPVAMAMGKGRLHVADAATGLRVYDIRDARRPRAEAELVVPDALAIAMSGDRILLGSLEAMFLIDVTNPGQPVIIGVLGTPQPLEESQFIDDNEVLSLALDERRAYLTSTNTGILTIVVEGDRMSLLAFHDHLNGDKAVIDEHHLWMTAPSPDTFPFDEHVFPMLAQAPRAILEDRDAGDITNLWTCVPTLDGPRDVLVDVAPDGNRRLWVADGRAGLLLLEPAPPPPTPSPTTAHPPSPRPTAGATHVGPGGSHVVWLPVAMAPAALGPKPAYHARPATGGPARGVAAVPGGAWMAAGRRAVRFEHTPTGLVEVGELSLPLGAADLDARFGLLVAIDQRTTDGDSSLSGAYPGPGRPFFPDSLPQDPGDLVVVSDDPTGHRLIGRLSLDLPAIDVRLVGTANRPIAAVLLAHPDDETSTLMLVDVDHSGPPRVIGTLQLLHNSVLLAADNQDVVIIGYKRDDRRGVSSLVRRVSLGNPEAPVVGDIVELGQFSASDVPLAAVARDGLAFLIPSDRVIAAVDLSDLEEPSFLGMIAFNNLPPLRESNFRADLLRLDGNMLHVLGNQGFLLATLDIANLARPTLESVIELHPLRSSGMERRLIPRWDLVSVDDSGGLWIAEGTMGGLRWLGRGDSPTILGHLAIPRADQITTLGESVLVASDTGHIMRMQPEQRHPRGLGVLQASVGHMVTDGDLAWATGPAFMLAAISTSTEPPTAISRVIGTDMRAVNRESRVAVDEDIAAVASPRLGISLFDVLDPESPHLISTILTAYGAHDVVLVGPTAFVAGGEDGLLIMDLRNPASPVEMARLDLDGHATRIVLDGTTAWLSVMSSRPRFPLYDRTGIRLAAVDVGDPARPRLLGATTLPVTATADLAIAGSLVLAAAGPDGLVMVDGSDPTQPRVAGGHSAPAGGTVKSVAAQGRLIHLGLGVDGLQTLELNAKY